MLWTKFELPKSILFTVYTQVYQGYLFEYKSQKISGMEFVKRVSKYYKYLVSD